MVWHVPFFGKRSTRLSRASALASDSRCLKEISCKAQFPASRSPKPNPPKVRSQYSGTKTLTTMILTVVVGYKAERRPLVCERGWVEHERAPACHSLPAKLMRAFEVSRLQ